MNLQRDETKCQKVAKWMDQGLWSRSEIMHDCGRRRSTVQSPRYRMWCRFVCQRQESGRYLLAEAPYTACRVAHIPRSTCLYEIFFPNSQSQPIDLLPQTVECFANRPCTIHVCHMALFSTLHTCARWTASTNYARKTSEIRVDW